MTVSLVAFKKWLASHPDYESPIEFSPRQRFFIAFGQIWRSLMRDEALKQQLLTDPHSPGLWRVDGILKNIGEFHEAFGVRKGDKMWLDPADRVKIW